MNAQHIVTDLASSDGRTRLRAIYHAGVEAHTDALPKLQEIANGDSYPELAMAANAAIQYINGSVQLDDVADAKSDIAWTQQFLQFLTQSTNFSPQDIEDLATAWSDKAGEIVKEAEVATQREAEREASVLDAGETYEMLWNCKVCYTKGLLGVSNRFCPNCGTAQDPEWRYFPEPGQYKKLVNHQYDGVDVTCPACGTLNGAASTYCVNCGADLATGEKAQIVTDARTAPVDATQQQWQADKARAESELGERKQGFVGRNRTSIMIGGLVAALIATGGGIFGAFFMRFSEEATVQSHTWERVYQVEQYQTVQEGRECPAPADARNVRTETRIRQVPDGQDCREVCTNQNVDQGDGSFRVEQVCRQECTTRYRDESYAYCIYDIDRWVELDEEDDAPWAIATGSDVNPQWPNLNANDRNVPECDDAPDNLEQYCWEKQEETLQLILERENGKTVTCAMDNVEEWRSWPDGATVRVNFTFFSRARGRALCDEMELIN